MKSLSDKNFMFDDDGSVIIIDNPDPKSLPPPGGMSVASDVFDIEDEPPPSGRRTPGSRRGKKKKPGSRGSSRGGRRSPKGKEAAGDTYFEVSAISQPSFIQTMTISAGVSLKEGRRGKSGPEVTGGAGHMSRKEYEERKAREEEAYYSSIGGSTRPLDQFDLDNSSVSSNESLTLDGTLDTLSLNSPRPETGFDPKISGLADVDSLSGAKPKRPAISKEQQKWEDPHDKLLSDPSWGKASISTTNVTPVRSKKPSLRQKHIISQFSGGPDVQNPRHRSPPVSMIPQKERSKLPAPALGSATGHGMPIPRGISGDDGTVGSKGTMGTKEGFLPPLVDDKSFKEEKKEQRRIHRQVSILGSRGGGVIKPGE